jgi:XTP/dITP diphosphohydrolase
VLSARFAGEPKSDQRNNDLLLERLAGQADRRARFYCALALVRHADDPQPLITTGEWRGVILDAPRGQAGFGYDPLFLVPDLEQTAAEIPAELKNVLSHRGSAFRQLLDKLRAEAA